MSEEQLAAVTEAEPVAMPETADPEAQAPEGDAPSPEAEPPQGDEKKRESAKERRDRDKETKARLWQEAETARRDAEAADARRRKVLEAGQQTVAPKEGEFQDYAEFVAAMTLWKYGQTAAQKEATEAGSAADQARQKAQAARDREQAVLVANYQRDVAEATDRYADFNAVVSAPGLFPTGSHLPELVLRSDAPADVAYHIARDRNLHDQLLQLPPIEAARAIGRIEAMMAAPKPRIETRAPEPVSPVRAKAGATRDPLKMNAKDYAEWRANGGTF